MKHENVVLSRYVYLFISSKNKNLIYNSRLNSFFEVSRELYDKLLIDKDGEINSENYNDETFSFLLEKKIVVKEEDDENFLLEHQYETDLHGYSKYTLGMTIVPTLGCNFSCHYCFEENKRAVTMSDAVEEAIIAFANTHTNSRQLDLNWYGGEPLMAIHIIERLLDKIAKETTLELVRHSIVTNGYYLNDKVISVFKKYPLSTMQITLDGDRERHNSIRKTKENLPTYDRILQNVDHFLDSSPDTEVHVRINIEKNNIRDYYMISNVLKERWKDKNVIIYPGFLRIDNDKKTAYSCNCLNRKEIAEMMFDVKVKDLLDVSLYPQLFSAKICAATRKNSYIIGPEGEVYKCWNDVGNPQKIVGDIITNKITNKELLYRYIVGSKWYYDVSCRKCFFLPICNGACAWYALRNQYEGGKYDLCTCMQKAPGMLDKCLEYFYDTRKGI